MNRRQFHRTGLASALSLAAGHATWAQARYPSRPITLIVAYAAGGSTDQRARQIGRFMADALGQQVLIDNKPGAAGNIGTDLIARAKPDGHTLGMGNLGPLSVNPWLFKALPFAPQALTKIALIEKGPLMLVVTPGSPYRSPPDLIAGAKAKAGGLSYGSSGAGSAHHLCGEMLKAATGAPMTHIPYRAGSAAMVDLLGGQLDFMFEPMYSALPSLRAKKVRALAITSRQRSPLAPELPTMAEAGLDDFHMENWQGLIAPPGLPDALTTQLNALVNQALADPTIRTQMLAQGNEPAGGTSAQFAELTRSERARWGRVVQANRIVPE